MRTNDYNWGRGRHFLATVPMGACWLLTSLAGCSGSVDGALTEDGLTPPQTTASAFPSGTMPGVVPSGMLPPSSSGASTAATSSPPVLGSVTNTAAPPPPPTTTPTEFAPAPGAYRRLTNAAFRNSLRDLLGGPVTIGALEPDSWTVGGLPTVGAAVSSVSALGVERYQTAVEAAVEQVFADDARRDGVLGCSPTSKTDTACFTSFVTSFGRKAFRQPLSEVQVNRYSQLIADVAETLDDAEQGMRAGLTGMLLSPNFLYRFEQGASVSGETYWRYTSHEMASRLAYFLTASTPDSELLELADQDGLQTVEAVQEQALRLLSGPAGRESIGNFATELFQLELVLNRAKDPTMYPEYTPELQAAMIAEVPAMFQALVFDRDASALELLTTRDTFVNRELGQMYGLTMNGATQQLQPVTLPEDGLRAGLLGTGAFLSIYASQKEGSPTLRGKFIRQVLMCQTIPDPPADVSLVIEEAPPGQVLTKREKLTAHREEARCAVCHQLTDPLGLTLENFDAMGGFRTTDQGKEIDISGDLDGAPFSGPIELGTQLAGRPEIGTCMMRNLYRYATGHEETAGEAIVLDELKQQFEAGGYRLRDMMLRIVTSDGFRYVAAPTP
jgi:Protein of unknown function (DUF1592)/Protein of unknown function (DUF1588)/Protein of unknown function (DUF1595)/Protein of unknown function (DUF1585)/Protein of unknown function (DUF1587)